MIFDCYFSRKFIVILKNSDLCVYELKYAYDDPLGSDSSVMSCKFKNKTTFESTITRDLYTHVLVRSGIFAKATSINKYTDTIFKIMSNRGYILINNNIFMIDNENHSADKFIVKNNPLS